ncbi:MAG: hypothetical protein ABL982_03545 [Vicinamibacterales bacterium]
MLGEFVSFHRKTADGKPAGGRTIAAGLQIDWQNGPLVVDGALQQPNGAFVETVIAAARDRLRHYQDETPFACAENALAMQHLDDALRVLRSRTERRAAAGTLGTHEKDAAE